MTVYIQRKHENIKSYSFSDPDKYINLVKSLLHTSGKDNNDKRENANIDGNSAMGTMLQIGSETVKEVSADTISPAVYLAHKAGDIHLHDLNFYPITFNCCQIPAGKLMEKGFSTGHGYIRQPNSIQSAAALMCIILQANQNEMYGGQAIPMFEYDLAPYVVKSFISNFSNLLKYEGHEVAIPRAKEFINNLYKQDGTLDRQTIVLNLLPDGEEDTNLCYKISNAAWELTEKQTYQAMEALIHNLNTMQSRAGAQVPFSSINYGTGTTYEQRLVIKSILEATDRGLGNGETPIFPVQVFKLKDGVNTSSKDPNYDLFRLACKTSAKRLYPNFSFIDSPYNLQYYKEGKPETELAVMGCFSAGHWIRVLNTATFNIEKVEISNFVENYDYTQYRAWDSLSGSFVEILNVINNPETTNFYRVTYEQNHVLTVTEDHFFPVMGKGRTNVKDLSKGDFLYVSNPVKSSDKTVVMIDEVKPLPYFKSKSYCLTTASDRFDVNGIVSNNCRTRVMGNLHGEEIPVGRGNFAFTTINLPRLGLLAKGDVGHFFKLLDNMLEICYTSLMDRYNLIAKKHVYNFPFLMKEHVWMGSEELEPEDTIEQVLKHSSLSIGFIGLAECLVALTGKHHGESEEAQELGLRIIKYMRTYCDGLANKTNLNFSLFATPAEGLSGRFVKMDREIFGEIQGVTNRDYYTNSSHVPVYYDISAAKKIELEAPYHELCNAGHIIYVEVNGDISKNINAFESLILYMKKNNCTYGSINHPVDHCPVCGYTGIIYDHCPKCGRADCEEVSIEHLEKIGCNCS